jgi:uncharacterized membrane protein YphA (DoxX/SURF4 family)
MNCIAQFHLWPPKPPLMSTFPVIQRKAEFPDRAKPPIYFKLIPRTVMNLTLWIAQALLAIAFVTTGTMKLFTYKKYKALSEKKGPTGITRGLAAFIGVAELAGGLGVILPMGTNVAPWLSPWAAVGLATIMLLAMGFHLRRRESPGAPVILLLLAVFVAFGRFSHWT